MASQVQIVNEALGLLGEPSIVSIDDEIERARTMKALWDGRRDSLIEEHRWGFAMARAELPALAGVPPWGFDYAYQMPVDCIRLDQVGEWWAWDRHGSHGSAGPEGPWSVEGRTILSNETAPLAIRYIRRVEDPGLFPPLFAEALACKLASWAASRQTESNPKAEAAEARLMRALRSARRVNAIQQPAQPMQPSSWLASRF